jgi:hypothetical protein
VRHFEPGTELKQAGSLGSWIVNSRSAKSIGDLRKIVRYRVPTLRGLLVKRLTMLVTADGEWVLEGSAEFLAALGDPEPDYDAGGFAVKNLGFVRFQILDDSVIEIEIHPRNTQLPALLAVQQQILSSSVKLFRIKHLETTWHSEIMISAEQAISRLSELCCPEIKLPSNERFLVEARDYSELFIRDGRYGQWRKNGGCRSGISIRVSSPLRSSISCFRE